MNNIKNNRLIWIVLLMWLCFLAPAHADSKKEGIDVQDIVFSHIQDAYTWHITEWNGKEIAISLPILVKSEERGWDMFLSHHLHHGQAHHNYYIATEGEHAGKVVEKNSRGEEVRPVDLSLTKNVCGLFLSCGILLFVILRTAHWYKRHPNQVPSGFTGLMEMIISYIQDGVIKESIGKEEYRPFSSYLLTVFFFILINNFIGLIPGMKPGTGAIGCTAALALVSFVYFIYFGIKKHGFFGYFKSLAPAGVAFPMNVFVWVIELFSLCLRLITLAVRLFCNMFAGHIVMGSFAIMATLFAQPMLEHFTAMNAVGALPSVAWVLILLVIYAVELIVAFVQAYVFTVLEAVYIQIAEADAH